LRSDFSTSHRTSKSENIDHRSASMAKDLRAFLNCRPRSVDIIYEQDLFLCQPFRSYDGKRATDIGAALAGSKLGLRYRWSGAF
jgi:hypothetical protein